MKNKGHIKVWKCRKHCKNQVRKPIFQKLKKDEETKNQHTKYKNTIKNRGPKNNGFQATFSSILGCFLEGFGGQKG